MHSPMLFENFYSEDEAPHLHRNVKQKHYLVSLILISFVIGFVTGFVYLKCQPEFVDYDCEGLKTKCKTIIKNSNNKK